jgi:hypothetical protein
MRTLTVTGLARRLGSILESVEKTQEDVMVVRNRRRIARIIPEPRVQDALSVLKDLQGTLDEDTASALLAAMARGRRRTAASRI